MLHIILASIVSGISGYAVKAVLARAHLDNLTADYQSAHEYLFTQLLKAKAELAALKSSMQVKL